MGGPVSTLFFHEDWYYKIKNKGERFSYELGSRKKKNLHSKSQLSSFNSFRDLI